AVNRSASLRPSIPAAPIIIMCIWNHLRVQCATAQRLLSVSCSSEPELADIYHATLMQRPYERNISINIIATNQSSPGGAYLATDARPLAQRQRYVVQPHRSQ